MMPRRTERTEGMSGVLSPTNVPIPSNPSQLPWRIAVRLDEGECGWEYYYCSTRRLAMHVIPLLREQGKKEMALGQWDRWTHDYVSAKETGV